MALLHARGARVVAVDLRPGITTLPGEFPGVLAMRGGITQEETAVRAVRSALDTFEGLDILVNHAGRTLNKPVTETTAEDWDAVRAVNARGAFFCTREAFRAMKNRGGATSTGR